MGQLYSPNSYRKNEYSCVKHAQSGYRQTGYRFQIDSSYVISMRVDGRKRCETLRVDANFFEKEEKMLHFQTNRDACRRGRILGCGLIRVHNLSKTLTHNFLGMIINFRFAPFSQGKCLTHLKLCLPGYLDSSPKDITLGPLVN